MNVSISTSVYVNYKIEDAIQNISKIGFDGIDIWGGRPHIYRNDFSSKELKVINQSIRDVGLTIPSFMPAFYRYPYNLSHPKKIVRLDSIDYMYRCLDNAAELGAKSILIIPGHSLSGQSREDARQNLIDSIGAVLSYAEQYPLLLAIEPVNRYVSDLINTATDALEIIKMLDSDRIGVTLDTGHINLSNESFQEAINLSHNCLIQLHINDNDGKRQQNIILGEGNFNFSSCKNILKSIQYDGFITVELDWQYTLDPNPAAEKVIQQVRELFI